MGMLTLVRRAAIAVLGAFCCWTLPLMAQSDGGGAHPDSVTAVSLTGFVAAAAFWQSRAMGTADGQAAEFALDTAAANLYGTDMRDTRLGLVLSDGHLPDGWTGSGLVSFDFFGGFKGSGTVAFLTPRPRVREAYLKIKKAGTAFELGQVPSILFPYLPTSEVHRVSLPLGFGSAGVPGSYYPGLELQQDAGKGGPVTWKFTLAATSNAWKDVNGSDNIATPTSLAPQIEGRVDATMGMANGASWKVFAAGHWDHKNLVGTGDAESALTGWLGEAGTKYTGKAVTVAGSWYYGHAVGQQFGNLSQYGDISGWGGWAQLGLNLNRHWSVWTFGGISKQHDDAHSEELLRPENKMVVPMLRYTAGPLAVSLEWMHVATDWFTGPSRNRVTRTGDQVALGTVLRL